MLQIGLSPARAIYLLPIAICLLEFTPLPSLMGLKSSAAFAQTTPDHRLTEADRLHQQGVQHFNSGQLQHALDTFQRELELRRALGDRPNEWRSLSAMGRVYQQMGQMQQAQLLYEQALALAQEMGDRPSEVISLNNLGTSYVRQGGYQQALGYYERSLAILQDLGDRQGESYELNNIGFIYEQLGHYQQALDYYEQSLAIRQERGDRQNEAVSLNNIGGIYNRLGQYPQALSYFEQALAIFRDGDDRRGEGYALNNIGSIYDRLGQYPRALNYYEQSLVIRREVGDRPGEAVSLNNMGSIYDNLGQYPQALSYYEQSLAITQEMGDRPGEARVLNNMGLIYARQGSYPQALSYYERSLPIYQAIGDRQSGAILLNNIGFVYDLQGQYQQALDYYERSLSLRRELGDRRGEGEMLSNVGMVYHSLGQYQQALDYYEQSLIIRREIGDRSGEGYTLNNIGGAYNSVGEYQQALDYYKQSLGIRQEIGDRDSEGEVLNNIGSLYLSQGQYQQALTYYEQSLVIRREVGDRRGEGTTLNNIGFAHDRMGQDQQALGYYEQSLTLLQEIGDQSGVGNSLTNIGRLLADQGQVEMAIAFLKQSVNTRESIRGGIRSLPQELQQSYTNSIAGDYRYLATLLLEQDRVMEALVVSDLLKVQELQDFLRDIRGIERSIQGVEMLVEEQQFIDGLPSNQLSTYIQQDEIRALMARLRQTAPAQNLTLAVYDDLQTRLQNLGTNPALFFPLILGDRIELILFTRDAPPIHRSVRVSNTELEAAIQAFRADLENPRSQTIQTSAQQLYQWLIEPIEDDLQNADIETLIYASDGQMRYIPLAALYDGEQWLIENYQINYITALSLTDIAPRSLDNPQIIAGAFSETYSAITIGGDEFTFGAIPFALDEVETLATVFPGTKTLLDDDFSRNTISADQISPYDIVHLATHGKLVSGTPENSFILLNNDEYITLSEIRNWQLPNAALVVLSACQTALGEQLGSGIEVVGFGYQLQQAQARAAIASLWEINDATTSNLMNTFYALLQSNEMSPIEALRQAQIALITNDYERVDERFRGMFQVAPRDLDGEVSEGGDRLKHPYYWAPFILIGNGL